MMDHVPSNAGHGRVQRACHASVRYRKGWGCTRFWLSTLKGNLVVHSEKGVCSQYEREAVGTVGKVMWIRDLSA